MADEIKYQINVQIADNTVTKDDPDDKIFNVVSQGTADKERGIAEMMAVNPGLERETLRHVLDLENRVVMKLLLNGMRVNNGLFEAEMREAIRSTTINVIGEKGSTFYLSTSLDAATGATDFSATPGANLTLTGKNIKVAGDDPSVGIALIASDDTETKIPAGAIGVNQPSKLVFVIPATLAAGDYTLRLTTQFSGSSASLKEPRILTQTLHLAEGGGTDSPGNI